MGRTSTKDQAALPAAVATPEPMGIVISRGRDIAPLPRFSAYVYAPGPDEPLAAPVLLTT